MIYPYGTYNEGDGKTFKGVRKNGGTDENYADVKIWVSSDNGEYTTENPGIYISNNRIVSFNQNTSVKITGYNPVNAIGLIINDSLIYWDKYGGHSTQVEGFIYNNPDSTEGDFYKPLEDITFKLDGTTGTYSSFIIR